MNEGTVSHAIREVNLDKSVKVRQTVIKLTPAQRICKILELGGILLLDPTHHCCAVCKHVSTLDEPADNHTKERINCLKMEEYQNANDLYNGKKEKGVVIYALEQDFRWFIMPLGDPSWKIYPLSTTAYIEEP